jgi:hypothetical protein
MLGKGSNDRKRIEPLLLGLLALTAFVSLPEPLDTILSLGAAVPVLIFGAADLWGVLRREHAEYVAERERIP